MNEKLIKNLENRITFLEEKCSDLKKNITALAIDKQLYVKNNKPIDSGIATKVSFDNHGVITGTYPLNLNDIPQLDMDHIAGLYDALNNKASAVDLNKMKKEFETYKNSNKIESTATKVNVDKYGKVVSSAELLPEDIPELSIDKINGLQEVLDIIGNKENEEVVLPDVTSGGTSCKLTYDSKGRVIDGNKLTIDDIPMELIIRLNTLESTIASLASIQSVKTIQNELGKKIDKNVSINPGVYTKVNVDKNGLVTEGSKLTVEDLPAITPDNIEGLSSMIKNKVDINIINDLKVTLSSIQSTIDKIPSKDDIDNKISGKVDKIELNEIKNELNNLTDNMNNLISSLDIDKINNSIEDLYNRIDNLHEIFTDKK